MGRCMCAILCVWSDSGLLLVNSADLNLLRELSAASVVFREDLLAAFLNF